jgi:hypothetical protein
MKCDAFCRSSGYCASTGASHFIYGHDNIELDPGDTAYLDFGKWAGNGSSIPLEIDRGSDGSIDETLQLTDE